MALVHVDVQGDTASFRIEGFLGAGWSAYNGVCATHAFRWNRERGEASRNAGPARNLPEAIAGLVAAGLEYRLSAAARSFLEATAASGLTTAEKAALEHCRAQEARVADRGISLRPYQRDGVVFLASRDRALLGDEMGLGKTVQALLALPARAAAVVVAPASVKVNWAREARRWRPDLAVTVMLPSTTPSRAREVLERDGIGICYTPRWPGSAEVVIWSYETMGCAEDVVDDNDDLLVEGTLEGDPVAGTVLIGDEIHRVKNRKAKVTIRWETLRDAVKEVSGRVWGVSGTPLYNRPPDLATVLKGLGAFGDVFTSWSDFVRRMGGAKKPVRVKGGRIREVLEWSFKPHPSVADSLRRVMIRREKAGVLGELPPKTYQDIEAVPGKSLSAMLADITEDLEAAGVKIDDLGRGDATMSEYAKLGVQLEKLVPFAKMSKLHRLLSECGVEAAMELIEETEEQGLPQVVYAVHKEPVEELGRREGWTWIDGGISATERAQRVADFQAGKYVGMAMTIACAIGVTLTRASIGTFLTYSWTPSENEQAEDRLHRIGQANSVLIRRVLVQHPLTMRIAAILFAKKHQVDTVIGKATVVDSEADRRAKAARDAIDNHDVGVMIQALKDEERAKKAVESESLPSRSVDVSAILDKVPAGGYALDSVPDAAGKTHTVFWLIDRPDQGKWAGWTFIKVQQGPSAGRFSTIKPDRRATPQAAALLGRIAQSPLEAARRYGIELGMCSVCGQALTNEESRQFGIGPICRTRFGA